MSKLSFNNEMRALNSSSELTYESFIETYGSVASPIECRRTLRRVHSNDESSISDNNNSTEHKRESIGSCEEFCDDLTIQVDAASQGTTKHNGLVGRRRRLRKISMEKFSFFGGSGPSAVSSRKSKSIGVVDQPSISPQSERRISSWFPGLPPYIARKLSNDDVSSSTEDSTDTTGSLSARLSTPKPALFRIPATRLRAADHRGYLDRRNKKKQWERFWCVLQDTCLYCYNGPHSDVTQDAVLLRGYDVVADVTNLNKSRFVLRLQQKGVPTLHFSTDNHRDFLLWVGTLERETRYVSGHTKRKSLSDLSDSLSDSSNQNLGDVKSTPNQSQHKPLRRTSSHDKVDRELITMQKHRLLKDIALQRERIIEEQKLLDDVAQPPDKVSPARRRSRVEVLENYESAKMDEEVKVTKFLTHLNRRRNSAQLKMDQFTKELAPKNGRNRRDNHAQFSSMESRLREMQEALAQVDRQIIEEEAAKQHNLEKLQYKRDLELVILEQRETLEIMRRHNKTGFSHVRHRRHSAQEVSSRSLKSCDTLASIDEISSISDERCASQASSSGSSSGASRSGIHLINRAMSTPRMRHKDLTKTSTLCTRSNSAPVKRRPSNDGATSSDADSGIQASRATEYQDEPSNMKPLDGAAEKPDGNETFCQNSSFVRENGGDNPTRRCSEKRDEIDLTTLAKIEDFENFAKAMLQRKHSSP